MSNRILARHRDKIAARVREHVQNPLSDECAKRESELAMRVYRERYPEELRDMLASLPRGVVPMQTMIRTRYVVDSPCATRMLNLPRPMPMPASDTDDTIRTQPEETVRLVQQLERDKVNAFDQGREAANEARAVVKSVTTFTRLREVWPNGKPFYEDLVEDKSLPVANTRSLDSKINSVKAITKENEQ